MTEQHDPTILPEGLPVPVDDGAADHLPGRVLPRVVLKSTSGETVDLVDLAERPLVIYVYPAMGEPGVPSPEGWDDIPGARGCTPQSCAFRDLNDEFDQIGFSVFGLSAQSTEEQAEAAQRLHLPFPLLADPGLELVETLDLPTFETENTTYYKRLTLVTRDGAIEKVFYPVFPPNTNAQEVLNWLRDRRAAP